MRGRSALALAVAASLGVTASALAAAGPTGSQQAIAIARAESHAYNKVPVEIYSQTGYIDMTDLEGKSSYFSFNWGQSKLPAGWVWATEHATVVLSHGRVVWWRDDLTPPPCTGVGLCHQVPVEILSEHSGAYYAFGSAASHTCFGTLRGSQPVRVGTQWIQPGGHFSAPVFAPGVAKLTYTFAWGKGHTARETDTLSSSTHLLQSTRVVIPGGHTIKASERHPSKAPKAPPVNRCSG